MRTFSDDSPHDGQHDERSRRRFLLGLGAATALAGCLGGDQGDETDTVEDEETATPATTDETATPDSDTGDEDDQDGLSPSEARELVPPDSLALRYEPPLDGPFGEFWAAVVGRADATAIRVEAASGASNEVAPRDGTIDGYLGVPVQVDPAGDEVTVYAADSEGTFGRVTRSRVPTDELTTESARQAIPSDALSFDYHPPGVGDFGQLTVEVTADTGADTLVAQPLEAPGAFTDRVGDLGDESALDAGTTLDVAVDPEGDEVVVSATVGTATGEITRWQGPD